MKYKKKKVSKRMQDEMDMMLADQVIVDSLDMIRVRRNRVLCLNCGGKRYGGGTLCIECFRSVHRILKRQQVLEKKIAEYNGLLALLQKS